MFEDDGVFDLSIVYLCKEQTEYILSGAYCFLQLCYYSFSKATLICFTVRLACWKSACFETWAHFSTILFQDVK